MASEPDRHADPFARLRAATVARIGLGRAGQGLPTSPMLAFQLAHARACDAVHTGLDIAALQAAIGGETLTVSSAAPGRAAYLKNPHLGRMLAAGTMLPRGPCDLAIVVADGLSAMAVQAHAPGLVQAIRARLAALTIGPTIVAEQARVALGDDIGARLNAAMVLVLIGERPGLSAADSLGAYLTFAPAPGRRDSERNCVSNIRAPGGLATEAAADKLAWLMRQARRLGLSGIGLKDRHGADGLSAPTTVTLPAAETS